MISTSPRFIILLILAVSLLAGCTANKRSAPDASWQSYNGMAGISREALNALANHTAQKVTDRYPPGRTTLGLYYTSGDSFGPLFETALRQKGFSIDSSEEHSPTVLQAMYIMDSIGSDTSKDQNGYLRLKFSDGYSTSHIYGYTPETGFIEKGVATSTEAFFAYVGSDTSALPTEEKENSTSWIIKPGSLKKQLTQWTEQAGYQLIWKAPHDFEMQADAAFKDNFYGAVKRLFTRMNRSGNSLRVTLYQQNSVLEVRED